MESDSQDVTAVIEQLRSQDIDVVRVSYSDMIGIDRGRDVLLSELPGALQHGLAFSRCIFHTTPTGETIPIQGGIEDGLPDVIVKPDLSTLAPLPWEPGVMHCLVDGPDEPVVRHGMSVDEAVGRRFLEQRDPCLGQAPVGRRQRRAELAARGDPWRRAVRVRAGHVDGTELLWVPPVALRGPKNPSCSGTAPPNRLDPNVLYGPRP